MKKDKVCRQTGQMPSAGLEVPFQDATSPGPRPLPEPRRSPLLMLSGKTCALTLPSAWTSLHPLPA